MIKDNQGCIVTPNEKAKELILDRLLDLDWFWCEQEIDRRGMTDKEVENISIQLMKRINTIHRTFGYAHIYKIK